MWRICPGASTLTSTPCAQLWTFFISCMAELPALSLIAFYPPRSEVGS